MAVLDYYFSVISVPLIWKDLYKGLGKKGGNVTKEQVWPINLRKSNGKKADKQKFPSF